MSKLIWMATVAAMTFSAPVLAQGKGKGASAKAPHSTSSKRNAQSVGQARTDVKARTDARANMRANTRTGASVDRQLDRNGNGIPDYRDRTLADANNNGIADYRERSIVDINRNGVADYRERLIDRNRDGVDDRAQNQYAGNVCPPGLAKKSPACVPPGQAKRMFEQGQRIPSGYEYFTDYNRIPDAYRSQVPYLESNRYIYRDNRVYIVDPTTRLVTRIIDLIR